MFLSHEQHDLDGSFHIIFFHPDTEFIAFLLDAAEHGKIIIYVFLFKFFLEETVSYSCLYVASIASVDMAVGFSEVLHY
jgi:hypothetical protein